MKYISYNIDEGMSWQRSLLSKLTIKSAVVTAVALAVALAMVLQVSAAVTFDPETGTGFVGKGDVQVAFDWNNAKIQENAKKVTFTYDQIDTYEATCEWVTGVGTRGSRTHTLSLTRSKEVQSNISYDARMVKGQKQITGYTLNGMEATITQGTVPVVGGQCPVNQGTEGKWTTVVKSDTSESVLNVHYDDESKPLQ